MAQPPAPDIAGQPASDGQEILTPQTLETVLADFRSWLEQAAVPLALPASAPPAETIDLHTLLAQFIALRHEVHLQTRAARAQQEEGGEALRQLSEALEMLRQRPLAIPPAPDDEAALRPLVKAVLDARDALALAAPEVERGREAVLRSLEQLTLPAPPPEPPALTEPASQAKPAPSLWRRWFGGQLTPDEPPAVPAASPSVEVLDAERRQQLQEAAERVRLLFDSVLTGYTMSLQRLDRVLQQCGLEPISCLGQHFDPEQMEVVAVVPDSGRPAGEVIQEVRPGYRWRGRVFRYAQVSVAQS